MSADRIILGTRGSSLALRQAAEVLGQLHAANPDIDFQIVTVATSGDLRPDDPITRLGVGAFVIELETALFRRKIDVAVHSLKDLPTIPTPGLQIAAVTPRQDPRDCLIDQWNLPIDKLPRGARIGTGSPRRTSQILHLRPDLSVLPIRGNIDTRLRKANGDDFDGIVVAMAGLIRLGMQDEVTQPFDTHLMVPAPGQGALALQCRDEDEDLASILTSVSDPFTTVTVHAERLLLSKLGGGCQLALGAHASVEGDVLKLTAFLGKESGTPVFKVTETGSIGDAEIVANQVYLELMRQGAVVEE